MAKMSYTPSNGTCCLRILFQIEKIDLVRLLMWYLMPSLPSLSSMGTRNRAMKALRSSALSSSLVTICS